MKRLILPVLLAALGLGAGVGAGLVLRPPPQDPHEEAGIDCLVPGEATVLAAAPADDGEQHDFVKLNNQFVVPIVADGRVGSLVVLSITLEVTAGQSEAIYEREPKLRDQFLQVLFDHANAGGFTGTFTATSRMTSLRTALREVARQELGNSLIDVLILDLVRQDS